MIFSFLTFKLVAQRTQAPPERIVMRFEVHVQDDVCLPTALGCHLVEAATSVRRRFGAALSDKQSARPSQQATPFPFERLMNNFRIGANFIAIPIEVVCQLARRQFAPTSRRSA